MSLKAIPRISLCALTFGGMAGLTSSAFGQQGEAPPVSPPPSAQSPSPTSDGAASEIPREAKCESPRMVQFHPDSMDLDSDAKLVVDSAVSFAKLPGIEQSPPAPAASRAANLPASLAHP